MRSQYIYCVSHAPPLTPAHLLDYTVGIGDYYPTRGAHISSIDSFWNTMRPVSFGAAGNYVIPKVMERNPTQPALSGVFSHRKMVIRQDIGQRAVRYPVYREVNERMASQLPRDATYPNPGKEFLIGQPLELSEGVVRQYAQAHHALDLFEYVSIAVRVGVLLPQEVNAFSLETVFIPGGCELGVYPTQWLCLTLQQLESVGREFVARYSDRLRGYNSYQVRAVGFLAERLGSFLLLKELRRRYPAGTPTDVFGYLCVIVPDGEIYERATVELGDQMTK